LNFPFERSAGTSVSRSPQKKLYSSILKAHYFTIFS
jgi:hypothetical protein